MLYNLNEAIVYLKRSKAAKIHAHCTIIIYFLYINLHKYY